MNELNWKRYYRGYSIEITRENDIVVRNLTTRFTKHMSPGFSSVAALHRYAKNAVDDLISADARKARRMAR